MTYIFFTAQALCQFVAGDYSGALSSAERSSSINPSSDNHLYMAAALAELGEMGKAREHIKRALIVSPKMNLVVIGRGVKGNPGWEKYHAALRKAGLPE
jgi:Flp pilus assembly protein TadD